MPTDNVEEATSNRPSKKSKSTNHATTDQEDTIEDTIESVFDGDAAPVQNNQGVEEHVQQPREEATIQHPNKMIKASCAAPVPYWRS